ncbi:MAG: class I SAM-dependent methyltransferase [Elusimicrobiota bacterium]
MNELHYAGRELELFEGARNWKRYWSSEIRPFLGGDILEVGAGLGANTEFIKSTEASAWMCLEPDPELASRMRGRFSGRALLAECRVEVGTTEALSPGRRFDGIVYVDTLEHIEEDRGELERAARLLRAGGRIVVLAPAHQWLYSPFDRAVGHFRRYDRLSLAELMPSGGRLLRLDYLDSAGLLASAGNRVFLQRSAPSRKQVFFWDRFLVPSLRLLDRLTFHMIGKSILGVWEKGRRRVSPARSSTNRLRRDKPL